MHKSYDLFDAYKRSSLPSPTRLVLIVIATHQNFEEKRLAFPSIELLARETGLSERSVKEHIKIAADHGWLRIEKAKGSGKKYLHNRYHLTFPSNANHPVIKTRSAKPRAPRASSLMTGTFENLLTDSKPGAPNDTNHVHHVPTNNEANHEVNLESKTYRQSDEKPSPPPSLETDESEALFPEVPGKVLGHAKKHGVSDIENLWRNFVCLDGMQRCDPEQYLGVFFDWLKNQAEWKARTNPQASVPTAPERYMQAPEPVALQAYEPLETALTAIAPNPEPEATPIDIPEKVRIFARERNIDDAFQAEFAKWHETAASYRPDPLDAFKFYARTQGGMRI